VKARQAKKIVTQAHRCRDQRRLLVATGKVQRLPHFPPDECWALTLPGWAADIRHSLADGWAWWWWVDRPEQDKDREPGGWHRRVPDDDDVPF
jgi:hypothetical protein